jgi:predicted transposase YdaD
VVLAVVGGKVIFLQLVVLVVVDQDLALVLRELLVKELLELLVKVDKVVPI